MVRRLVNGNGQGGGRHPPAPDLQAPAQERVAALEATYRHLATKEDLAGVRLEVADVKKDCAVLNTKLNFMLSGMGVLLVTLALPQILAWLGAA